MDVAGDLIITGSGDPFLVWEEVIALAITNWASSV